MAVLQAFVPELAEVVTVLRLPLYQHVQELCWQAELACKTGTEKRVFVENHIQAFYSKHTEYPFPALSQVHLAIQVALIRYEIMIPFGGGGLRGRGPTGIFVAGGATEDLMYSHMKVK